MPTYNEYGEEITVVNCNCGIVNWVTVEGYTKEIDKYGEYLCSSCRDEFTKEMKIKEINVKEKLQKLKKEILICLQVVDSDITFYNEQDEFTNTIGFNFTQKDFAFGFIDIIVRLVKEFKCNNHYGDSKFHFDYGISKVKSVTKNENDKEN